MFGQGTGPIWADEIQCGGVEEKLSYCPIKKRNQQNCTHAADVSIVCFGYTEFRLVNGPDRCSGRLEMKYGGQWGTVCDHGWDLRDATVLCQQLQCGHAEAVLGPDRFGQGSGSVFTDVFDCEGTETALGQCPISPWTHSTCTNRSDLGVVCSRAVGSVRLLGGESRCEGRVEVFYSGSWGRLQGQSGVGAVASVLCRQLDCGAAVQTTSSSRYGPGRSEVCLTGLRCSGNETHLQNCSRPQTETCGSGSDVGVLCEKHMALQLVGGEGPCAGRLEVYHRGSWGTVCDDSWDLADAQVVCRQLQCGTALTATAPGSFGQGEGPIWLDEVRCEGNESSLWDCPARPWEQHDCSHKEDVAIVCSEFKQLRLVSEQFECAGRVEVFYNGTWGSVCMNSFNSFTANLICGQLNCGDYFSYDYAKEVSGLNRLDDIKCTKHHTSLWQCPSSPWGENNCDNGEVVEIICAETDRLRLSGGPSNCSGQVEVLFMGAWGSVCDDSWDLRDAQVVCRQLGCGEAESTVGGAAWGEGNGTVWLDEVNCRGSELHLWDCEHPALGQSDCQHKEDAGVNCASESDTSIRLSWGHSNCSGRVEVLFRGVWGSVCDDSWDLRDAQVVCRQLGCGEAESTVGEAAWEGSGTVWLDEVNCRGSELYLWDCEHPAPGLSRCQRQRRAAVRCAEPPQPRPRPFPPPPPPQAQPGQSNLLIVCAALGALVFMAAVLALVQTLRYRDLKREFAQLETTSDPLQDGLYEEIDHKLQRQGTYSQYRAGSLLSEELSYDDVGAEGSAAAASLPASEDDYEDVKEEEDASVPEIKKEPPGKSSPDLDYHGYEEVEEPEGASCLKSCPMMTLELKEVRLQAAGNPVSESVKLHQPPLTGNSIWAHESVAEKRCSVTGGCSFPGSFSLILRGCQHLRLVDGGHRCDGRVEVYKDGQWGTVCVTKWYPNDGDTVRLSGGGCRGRLEVNRGGTYKTVCPQSVDSRDADVVCRELGCGVSGAVLGGAVFRQGTGPIWADEIQCWGNEGKLSHCPVKKRNQHNCTHADDISIDCFGYTDFRLVNGPDRCSGRLEMKYGGQWGTVCDRDWDLRDATVLCQQLQCGHAEAVLGPDRFGQGNGSVFTDVFDCEGTETTLGQCPISPWTHSTCTNRSDLGVICSRAVGSIRLLGGESRCEGRVEVFYSGSWGRLQGQSGVGAVASVLCRQLDCGAAVQTTSSSRYGPGRSEVCLTGLRCSGNETHLQNCSRPQTETCGSGSDVGVLCEKHRALRVVGGEGPCAGRLEVYHSGSWGTVCDDSWDLADAQVVCRQLQCGTALTATALGFFGQVEGPIWLDEVRCEGNESSLWDCPARPWGQHDCSHKEDVAIMCSGTRATLTKRKEKSFKQLRLVSEQFECAGRVEVFYNGTWGSVCMNSFNSFTANLICQQLNCGDYFSYDYAKEVSETDRLRLYGGHSNCSGRVEVLFWGTWGSVCDDSWDLRDAQVVCRQLRCGEAESAVGGAAWGEGNSTVWLDEVNCRGSELHLWDCEHPALGQSDCQHKEDAGVNCATMQSIQLSRGSSNCSGQVEVLFRGIWGSVCDDSWDLRDAQVVCRQLGCGEAESAVGGAAWGEGNGTVWLDEVNCRGSELHLWDCEHPAPGLSRCQSQRRAAVRCAEPPKPRPRPLPPPPPPQTQPGQFNLLIVCAALGALVFVAAILALVQTLRYRDLKREFAQLETTSDPLQDGLYEEIDHKLHRQGTYSQYRAGSLLSEELSYDDVAAEGSAAAASLPASEDDYDDVKEEEDASVPGYTDFRLVNGPDRCSGRVEMKYGGQWGTVCDRDWDLRDATVLCQQLQCGHAEAVLGPDRFGQGNGSVFTDVFDCEGTETALGQCPISPWTHSTCTNRSDLGVICSRAVGSVRLLGGESRCEGRVEVFYSGSWGRLQGQSGVGAVASVLCRQLDCGAAVQTTSSSRYGPGRSEVCLTGLRCSGNETHLQNCSRPQTETCGSGSDVGVLCEKHRALRVVGGEGPCAGRLEVYHSGSWGTVCDDSWDLADAQVVCRQLQCGTALTATALGFFGQVEGPIWLDEVRCEGNESSLWDCPARPWGQHDCSHKEDVAIMCSEFKQLRLVSEQFECAGRVEVFYNGTWGSVCMNSFNSFTANLICQQLNCGDYFSYDYAKEVSGLNRLDDIKCTKHHTSLWQCPSSPWGENNCDNGEVVEIICAETDRLRLYGGHSNCSGRVEVLFWGTWGSVCDDSWDLRDAQVVCRQLGCGEAESAVGGAAWGEGNSTVWLDEVNCRGSELHLWDCEHPALGQSDCQHKEDAGVNCATMQSIQLSRGSSNCSGQVEVLFRGIWGSVCDDSWDLRDAQVVCRQLGCGEAESAVGGAAWGEGNGTVWLDEVNCRGSELHLWDCEHPAPGLSRCQSQRRAAVRCAEPPKPRPLPPPSPPPQTQPGQFNLLIVCAALGALVFVAAVLALVQTLRYRDQKREFAQLETTFDPLQDGLYEEIDHKLHRQGTYSQYRAGEPPFDPILTPLQGIGASCLKSCPMMTLELKEVRLQYTGKPLLSICAQTSISQAWSLGCPVGV
ncbi:deleted in malignant brain tumors 1 protein [Amia ocellicauda]|uniref:deleted in malignant brain tumors 1 protein n=1 Tax=Amia ocellicauda TaxID=2972642 RepID=UPI0034641E1D